MNCLSVFPLISLMISFIISFESMVSSISAFLYFSFNLLIVWKSLIVKVSIKVIIRLFSFMIDNYGIKIGGAWGFPNRRVIRNIPIFCSSNEGACVFNSPICYSVISQSCLAFSSKMDCWYSLIFSASWWYCVILSS